MLLSASPHVVAAPCTVPKTHFASKKYLHRKYAFAARTTAVWTHLLFLLQALLESTNTFISSAGDGPTPLRPSPWPLPPFDLRRICLFEPRSKVRPLILPPFLIAHRSSARHTFCPVAQKPWVALVSWFSCARSIDCMRHITKPNTNFKTSWV